MDEDRGTGQGGHHCTGFAGNRTRARLAWRKHRDVAWHLSGRPFSGCVGLRPMPHHAQPVPQFILSLGFAMLDSTHPPFLVLFPCASIALVLPVPPFLHLLVVVVVVVVVVHLLSSSTCLLVCCGSTSIQDLRPHM